MKLKQLLQVDVAFWIEFIVRSLVPAIAFLATCGLYVIDFSRVCRQTFDDWHQNWTQADETTTQLTL